MNYVEIQRILNNYYDYIDIYIYICVYIYTHIYIYIYIYRHALFRNTKNYMEL